MKPLTPRETQVLTLLAHGHQRTVIASQLGISLSTTRSHLKRIYLHLGAANAAHAVALGIAHHFIDIPSAALPGGRP